MDGDIPIVAFYSSANVHDSSVALPLIGETSRRVSYLYDLQDAGYDASAGALQIETSHPLFDDKKYTLEGQLKASSFGYFNPSFRYGQKVGSKVAVTMHGDWLTADGDYPFTLVNGTLREEQKRLNSDINSWRGEANVYADLQHAGRLQVKAYYFDSERGLPGSVSLYNPQARERL